MPRNSHARSKTMPASRKPSRTGVPSTRDYTELGALAREFMDVLEGFRNGNGGDPSWEAYFYAECVPTLNQSIQLHLKECPRCRSQSKVKQLRGRDIPSHDWTVPPTEVELCSLCEDGMTFLCEGVNGLPGLLNEHISTRIRDLRDVALSKCRLSTEERAHVVEFIAEHNDPLFSNLKTLSNKTGQYMNAYEQRKPLLERLEQIEETLRANADFFNKIVVPMHNEAVRTFAVSNARRFVLHKKEFLDVCEDVVRANIADFKGYVSSFLRSTGEEFFNIDGLPWETYLRKLAPQDEDDVAMKRRDSSMSVRRASSASRAQLVKSKSIQKLSAHDTIPAGFTISAPTLPPRGEEPIMFHTEDIQGKPVSNVTYIKGKSSKKGIEVIIRVRPMVRRERDNKEQTAVQVQPGTNSIHLIDSSNAKASLTFNGVAPAELTQQGFWDLCGMSDLMDDAMNGIAVTVMAYGQTGSGKTFSIAGPEDVLGISRRGSRLVDEAGEVPPVMADMVNRLLDQHIDQHGFIPRLVENLFLKINAKESEDPNLRYKVKVSYLEIYNEQVNDLLSTAAPLKVRERVGGELGFFAEGLVEKDCNDLKDMLEILVDGTQRRKVVSHQMNSQSSRSHAILTVHIAEKRLQSGSVIVRDGKFTVVDLAGSESVKKTKTSGSSLLETAGINKSLLSLSNVIVELAKNKGGHIAWRDSKLTQLLQDSLMGEGRTVLIACVSPSLVQLQETHSTLQFATKAGNISKRKVKELTPHELEVERLTALWQTCEKEVKYLRAVIKEAGIEFPPFDPNDESEAPINAEPQALVSASKTKTPSPAKFRTSSSNHVYHRHSDTFYTITTLDDTIPEDEIVLPDELAAAAPNDFEAADECFDGTGTRHGGFDSVPPPPPPHVNLNGHTKPPPVRRRDSGIRPPKVSKHMNRLPERSALPHGPVNVVKNGVATPQPTYGNQANSSFKKLSRGVSYTDDEVDQVIRRLSASFDATNDDSWRL